MQLVGTGTYDQVWDGSYNDVVVSGTADNGADMNMVAGTADNGADMNMVDGTADNGATPITDMNGDVTGYETVWDGTYADVWDGTYADVSVAGTADNGATEAVENTIDGEEIMAQEAIGRNFTAGFGYMMMLDNVFDSGIMSDMYIEPYMGVFSSASEDNVTFSTALRLGYRF